MSNNVTDLLSGFHDSSASRGAGHSKAFVMGVVIENNDDQNKGLVKVSFTSWEEGLNVCEWIPVLRSYAGGAYGSYTLPEIDDIVLVGFMGNMMSKPFVLGCLYPNGAAVVGETFEKTNLIKQFKTKGGNTVTMNDEDGKQSIKIITNKELTIFMEDENELITISDQASGNFMKLDCKNGGLQITTKKTVEVKSEEITLTGTKKIMMKAGPASISLDGNSGEIKIAGNKIAAEGKQGVDIKSNAQLNAKGMMVNLEAQTKLAAKGSAMAEIKGGIVKIN